MNLKIQLLTHIVVVALLYIIVSAGFVLYQTGHQSSTEAELTAKHIEKQMHQQLMSMFLHYDYVRSFPDIDLLQQVQGIPGSCTQFLSITQSRERSLCNDNVTVDTKYPAWFGHFYQQFFNPTREIRRSLYFSIYKYGTIVVTPNAQIEAARAWGNLQTLISVMMVTLTGLCILFFFMMSRLLQPATLLIKGLKRMKQGELGYRLPGSRVEEWKLTSEAINSLAASLETTLKDNRRLVLNLMDIQEKEHRHISRELHDEFGQCLAGINAVSASILQTAQKDCPSLTGEINSITFITSHMMDALRNLLTRLRPANVDELGLTASLEQLVDSWNQHQGNTTRYKLHITSELDDLPEPLPVNIYRIVQECLTNISKHAQAQHADITLKRTQNKKISLKIVDDGIAVSSDFDTSTGIGLLGIQERVSALNGQLSLDTQTHGGLIVHIMFPQYEKEKDS